MLVEEHLKPLLDYLRYNFRQVFDMLYYLFLYLNLCNLYYTTMRGFLPVELKYK